MAPFYKKKKTKKKTENIYREKLQILRLFCSRLTEVFLECVRSKNSKKLQNVLIMLSCVEFRAFLRDLNSTNVAPFIADSLRQDCLRITKPLKTHGTMRLTLKTRTVTRHVGTFRCERPQMRQ